MDKFTIISGGTYAGESAGKYISAAILSADTLNKGLVEVMPNIKYKSVIEKIATASLLSDASCAWTSGGTITLTERVIEPKELQVNMELCKQDMLASWEAVQMGYSAFDVLPSTFEDYLISHVAAKVSEAIETAMWQGSGATSGSFDGFMTLLKADNTALLASSGATVTSSNVIGIFDDALGTHLPAALFGKPDLNFYVAANVFRAYQKALAASGTTWNIAPNGDIQMNYMGVPVVLVPGMEASGIVLAQKSNLFFGTGLLSDFNQVKVLDMANLDGSQNVRIVMRFTAAVQYGLGSEIVYYHA